MPIDVDFSRTSETHPLEIAELPIRNGPGPAGLLGLTFCPGKKGDSVHGAPWDRDLDVDLKAIRSWGAAIIITLMEQHELRELQVASLGQSVRAHGMEWWHLPIQDVDVPDRRFHDAWSDVGPKLHARLTAGQRILIHCRGGLGRTGVVAAQILVERGERPAAAICAVRRVRPNAIETGKQEDYVRRCASDMPTRY